MENAPPPKPPEAKETKTKSSKDKEKSGGKLNRKRQAEAPHIGSKILSETKTKPEKPMFALSEKPEKTVADKAGPSPETPVTTEQPPVGKHLGELTPTIDSNADPATLTADERPATVKELVDASPPDDVEAVNEFRDKLKGDMDPDAALAEQLAEMQIPPEKIAELTAEPSETMPKNEAETDTETGLEPEADTTGKPDELTEDETVPVGHTAETPPVEATEAEPDDPATATTTAGTSGGAGTPPPSTPTGGGGHTGGAGGVPPHGAPVPPFGPPHGPGGPGHFPPGGLGGPGGSGIPAAALAPVAAANRLRPPEYQYANPAAAALLGGIVGYLIGRRRGRIKTEKKLLPVQKKLEKQVVDLEWDLRAKEAKIRKAAADQYWAAHPLMGEGYHFNLKAKNQAPQAQFQAQEQMPLQAQKLAEQKPTAAKPEQLKVARRPAPEAHQLHGSQQAPEHLGHMLVAAEAVTAGRLAEQKAIESAERTVIKPEQSAPGTKTQAELSPEKRVETLSRLELFSMSEKIVVDGTSLRQIYENHLIGERGLRRLVLEHLRGGDLKKVLRHEVVEREIDFERDPARRDLAGQSPAAVGGGKAVLDNLLQKAELGIGDSDEEAAFLKARTHYEADQQEREKRQRHLIDLSLVGIIATLIIAVLYLYLSRN